VPEKQVDARGLACPQPVVLARKAILDAEGDRVRVIVDREAAAENIQRMARSQGWEAQRETNGGEIHLTLTRSGSLPQQTAGSTEPAAESSSPPARPKVVVLVASNLFGVGDEKLGQILIRAFLKTLKEIDPRPNKVLFVNAGVRLTTTGSDVIEPLRELERTGIQVLSCGTCLDFYGLLNELQVGHASNMFEIAQALVEADRVVRP
jgi:selenium metabolism protein YedF